MSSVLPALNSGIYGIFNTENHKPYIGQSSGMAHRWDKHRRDLNAGVHINKHLQAAWNKYGEAAFEFRVVEVCPEGVLCSREVSWIEYFKSADPRFGYNKTYGGDGARHTPEVAARIAAKQRGKVASLETRAKQRAARLGRKFGARDPAIVEKVRRANLGKKRTPEMVARMVASRAGRKMSLEARAKISAALRGKKKPPRSPEHAKKIGDANRGKKRKPHSEEARRRMSEAQKKVVRGPLSAGQKEKIRASMLAHRARQRLSKAAGSS